MVAPEISPALLHALQLLREARLALVETVRQELGELKSRSTELGAPEINDDEPHP